MRSASSSASVFSRVLPAPVFTPAPVAVELDSSVCDCSEIGESLLGSEPDAEDRGCEDDEVVVEELRKGITTADVIECDIDVRMYL